MILLLNMKSSPGVYQYQSFKQEQTILLMNLISSPGIYNYQSHTLADDSINEHETITRCIELSIIHTVANDSINEYGIISSSQLKSDSGIHCSIMITPMTLIIRITLMNIMTLKPFMF